MSLSMSSSFSSHSELRPKMSELIDIMNKLKGIIDKDSLSIILEYFAECEKCDIIIYTFDFCIKCDEIMCEICDIGCTECENCYCRKCMYECEICDDFVCEECYFFKRSVCICCALKCNIY